MSGREKRVEAIVTISWHELLIIKQHRFPLGYCKEHPHSFVTWRPMSWDWRALS
jgi:hypothetical protein